MGRGCFSVSKGSKEFKFGEKFLSVPVDKRGNQSVTGCNHLKMQSADGKFYFTEMADTEQLFRLVQSIPSPQADF